MFQAPRRPKRRVASAWAALSAVLAACATAGLEPTSSAVEPTAVVSVGAAAAAPAVDDDPDRLLGLNRISVEKLLGRPRVVRSEAPAEILQYRAATCVLDLFLYADGGVYRVVFLEARSAAAQPVAARGCLNAVLTARRAPTAS